MESINGRGSVFAAFHCGTVDPPNPCNELTGLTSGESPCPGCQTAFHSYRVEVDRSTAPEQIRWYLDGVRFFTVSASQVDRATWENATNHGFFIILNVAIGGSFPAGFGGGPTPATVSGVPMLVDHVRVYTRRAGPTPTPTGSPGTCAGDCNGDGMVTVDELIHGVSIALGTQPLHECAAFDTNDSGTVTVEEIVAAVDHALSGCGSDG